MLIRAVLTTVAMAEWLLSMLGVDRFICELITVRSVIPSFQTSTFCFVPTRSQEVMLGFLRFFYLLLVVSKSLVDSQFTSSRNFLPASYPLAVKAPYLNTWISTPNGSDSLNVWPLHWDGINIMGWSGFARIDGVDWQWMGEGDLHCCRNPAIDDVFSFPRGGRTRYAFIFVLFVCVH